MPANESGGTDSRVEPEMVLKGVLNTLMSSSTVPPLTSTPGRRTTPTSAFSTPSRSFSSAPEEEEEDYYAGDRLLDDGTGEEEEDDEDYQLDLQYPSPTQPHLESLSPPPSNDKEKATAFLQLELEPPQMDRKQKKSASRSGPDESPRSALDDGIPFTTQGKSSNAIPGAFLNGTADSPTPPSNQENTRARNVATASPVSARTESASLRLAAMLASPSLPPRPPPSPRDRLAANRTTTGTSSVSPNHREGGAKEDGMNVDSSTTPFAAETFAKNDNLDDNENDNKGISYSSSGTESRTSVGKVNPHDVTVVVSNLHGLGDATPTTTTNELVPLSKSYNKEHDLSVGERTTPEPSEMISPVATPPGATWSSPISRSKRENTRNYTNDTDSSSPSGDPTRTTSSSPDDTTRRLHKLFEAARLPPKTLPDSLDEQVPTDATNASQFQSSAPMPPHPLVAQTPDRYITSQRQASPTGNNSVTSSTGRLTNRLSKAREAIRKYRGTTATGFLHEAIASDATLPPKPPQSSNFATTPPPILPPPRPPSAGVSPGSDLTPVLSNQQRKILQELTEEEKKDDEEKDDANDKNWSSSAVQQMNDAVANLRSLGESFLSDRNPPATPGSARQAMDAQSGVSVSSGPWWQKEGTAIPGDEADPKSNIATMSTKPPLVPNLAVTATSAHGSTPSRASPSPPPAIWRTAHDPNLVKPVPMEHSRNADVGDHPSAENSREKELASQEKTVSADSASDEPSARAMTPMMRMRVPGAQESVLMGESEDIPPTAVDKAVADTAVASKQPPSKNNVEFDATAQDSKSHTTPERSRRSKSSKGRSPGSNRSRSRRRGSRRRRRSRQKGAMFNMTQQCEGGIPSILNSLIDQQCGQFPRDESDSESTYSSDESEGSDVDTYLESQKSSPPHSTAAANLKKKEPDPTVSNGNSQHRDHEKATESGKDEDRFGRSVDRAHVSNQGKDQALALESGRPLTRHTLVDEERSVERVKRRQQEVSSMRNKNFIREFIAELASDGIKLLQHRRSHRQAFTRPVEVTAHLRLGTEEGTNGFCEPCLQFLAHDGIPVVSVDLFDVRSLEKATALQLQSYPFAVPGSSLLIRTNPGDFVFEAAKEEDAVRIVHGMRWLIARLSFNLIIGNVNVSCELLDVGHKAFKQRVGDSNRVKAMNDLANCLVEKSTLFFTS